MRKDIHRPSAINPDDYEFVAYNYLKIEDLGDALFMKDQRERLKKHMEATSGTWSNHEHGGNCHICGSVNAIYTAAFYHAKTNSYIRTGLDCAEILGDRDAERFRRQCQDALKQVAGKRKAEVFLTNANLSGAWGIYEDKTCALYEESTIRSIVGNLVTYGNLSDKQVSFIQKLLNQISQRPVIQAQREAEAAAAKPVPHCNHRMEVKGTVVSLKTQTDFYGVVTKVLVRSEEGWKVWGTLPKAAAQAKKGDGISFDALVTVSNNDPKFGFFSRPTQAVLTVAVVV